jgi:hypothetical protein
MKYLKTVFFVFILIWWKTSTHAQEGINIEGNVGLAHISSPNTLGKSKAVVCIMSRYTNYGDKDHRGAVREILHAGAYGITKNLDLGFVYSFININSHNNGLGNMSVSAKYHLCDVAKVRISLNSICYIPTGRKHLLLGSEKLGLQFGLSLGLRLRYFELLSNISYGYIDYYYPTQQQVFNKKSVTVSGGLLYNCSPTIQPFLEVVGQHVPELSDQDAYFQLGCIYQIYEPFIIKISLGFGLPDKDRANTDQRATLGLCYLLR